MKEKDAQALRVARSRALSYFAKGKPVYRERIPQQAPTTRLRISSSSKLNMVFSNRKATLIARPGQAFVRPNLPLGVRPFRVRKESLGICLILAFLLAASAARPGTHFAAADSPITSPVLVELFTSEGCSSCPPADALLEKLDALQPIPGTQLVVLSEHVDYWNHDGWTDPFSSASFTDRQSAYVRALGLKTPFTPQFLVDGTDELKTHDTQQIVELLRKAGAVTKLPMRLASVAVEPGNPAIVRGRVESDVNPEKRRADVYLAIALDHAESQVSRGENNGRHLVHVAVVTEFTRVGKLETGKSFGQDFRVKLKLPRPAPMNLRIVAFAQESGPGKVLGVVLKSVRVN